MKFSNIRHGGLSREWSLREGPSCMCIEKVPYLKNVVFQDRWSIATVVYKSRCYHAISDKICVLLLSF